MPERGLKQQATDTNSPDDTPKEQNDTGISPAVDDIWRKVGNKEIASILKKYCTDSSHTDIQTLLLNPDTRDRVIQHVGVISEIAKKSLVMLLAKGAGDVSMERSQADVDFLTAELHKRSSVLVEKGHFPGPEDRDYWTAESDFAAERKAGKDKRWLVWDKRDPWHIEMAENILDDARHLETGLDEKLQSMVKKAGLAPGSFMNISKRTKSSASLMDKVGKFRSTSWGKDATIADVFDMLGARIVVEDLHSLEKVMETLEAEVPNWPGAQILRKENKFLVNNGKPDPYRAIQYTIAIPDDGGQLHTFELQLKTFSSMIASDLFHNAVYKPEVLNLHKELQESVRRYNWQSDYEEMSDYLGTGKKTEKRALSADQEIDEAIETTDYNNFYDLVLNKIDAGSPLDNTTKDCIKSFHDKEVNGLRELEIKDKALFISLMAAAHESYFEQTAQDVLSPDKYRGSMQFGNNLPEEAVALLPNTAQERYQKRYENFNGGNNKISAGELGLLELTGDRLKAFLTAAGKDTASPKVAGFIIKAATDPDEVKRLNVMNLYHAHFSELNDIGEKISDKSAKQRWRKAIIDNQVGAVASSSILTEIGGKDIAGVERDLSAAAVGQYTKREMLTFLFFISAINQSSEFLNKSYEDFVTSESSAWARDYDRKMDRDIMKTIVTLQMGIVEDEMSQETDPILLARLQKARIELLNKYACTMLPNSRVSDLINNYYQQEVLGRQVSRMLKGGSGSAELASIVRQSAKVSNLSNLIEQIHSSPSEAEIFEELLMTVNDPEYLKRYIFEKMDGIDLPKIKTAMSLAEGAHKDKKRKEGTAYILHPLRVAIRLIEEGIKDPGIVIKALLHDIIENGNVDLGKLEPILGSAIVADVKLLSKKMDGSFLSDEDYYHGLENADNEVKRIKILDRIDNVRSLNMMHDEQWKANYLEATKKYVLPLSEFDPNLKKQLEMAIASQETG